MAIARLAATANAIADVIGNLCAGADGGAAVDADVVQDQVHHPWANMVIPLGSRFTQEIRMVAPLGAACGNCHLLAVTRVAQRQSENQNQIEVSFDK